MQHMINSLSNIKGKYRRAELIEKLIAFRDAHIAEYAIAIVIYREEVLKQVQKMLAVAEKQDFKHYNERVALTAPVDVADAYTKAITIFQHMTDDIIELEFDEAAKLLTDTWDWAVSAKATNMLYSAGSSR